VAKARAGALTFRFKALTIACTDHRRSERFYRQALGFGSLPTDDPGYGCPWLRLGSLAITLMPNAAERSPAEFPTHAMPIPWLEVDDLGAAARRFAREGSRWSPRPTASSCRSPTRTGWSPRCGNRSRGE
jgi:Glyoxalase/Bleomycin resistance protein/Dioxygenase superfamily